MRRDFVHLLPIACILFAPSACNLIDDLGEDTQEGTETVKDVDNETWGNTTAAAYCWR